MTRILALIVLSTWLCLASAFSAIPPPSMATLTSTQPLTRLFMSDMERSTSKKRKVTTIVEDKVETKPDEKKNKEEPWRVVLHNDEVHTFQYVIRSLTKVVNILDKQAAYEVCKHTHGFGKATVTVTWRKQAEQFCLALQRQGLTVSIAPDKDFKGAHSGGTM